MTLTFGSLFAGIGGFDLGFEQAGMKCKWQVENNPFATKVLNKNFPGVPRFKDVRAFAKQVGDMGPANEEGEVFCELCQDYFSDCECVGAQQLLDMDLWVDVICGGFPCQDTSNGGTRLGLEGARSGLWTEFNRIIRALGPRFVAVENVGALTVRGLQQILGDIHQSGFNAEWQTLSASRFGFPHKRDRLFIVAYASSERLEGRDSTTGALQIAAKALDITRNRMHVSEPFGIRTINGIPNYVDRITGLGNAVVPQLAEWIGRRIMEVERTRS